MADLANSSMAHNSAHAIMSTQQQHTMDLHMRNGEVSILFVFSEIYLLSNQFDYLANIS